MPVVMIVCQECGNTSRTVERFCPSCGALLEWSGEQVGRSGPGTASGRTEGPVAPPRPSRPDADPFHPASDPFRPAPGPSTVPGQAPAPGPPSIPGRTPGAGPFGAPGPSAGQRFGAPRPAASGAPQGAPRSGRPPTDFGPDPFAASPFADPFADPRPGAPGSPGRPWPAPTDFSMPTYVQPVPSGPAAVRPDEEVVRPGPVAYEAEQEYSGPFCMTCGVRNDVGRSFCRRCGSVLVPSEPEPVIAAPRLSWWQRWFGRSGGPSAPRAGERPKAFRERGAGEHGGWDPRSAGTGAAAVGKRRFTMPSRLPLSRVAPVLLILGVVGLGLGAFRQNITNLLFRIEHRVTARPTPLSTVSTVSAEPAAAHHDAGAATDTQPDTYWLSQADGTGQQLTVTFQTTVSIADIDLISGTGTGNLLAFARPHQVTVTAGGVSKVVDFPDRPGALVSKSLSLHGVSSVTIRIDSIWDGQTSNQIAVSTLQFDTLS